MSASSKHPSDLTGSQSTAGATGRGQSEKARARARVGQVINGKWRLDALLGVGGMATVYAATHRNGSRAALKILHAELSRDAGVRDRFLREGYVANKSAHRGAVSVLDDDVSESGEPFLVMELLEGVNAQQLWKRRGRRLPVLEALGIAEQVLDTLQSYHVHGVIHRDLKPANIFITNDGIVKVLDFGVARMRDAGGDRTRAGTALGTPSFMAPEQAMGVTDGLDARADVFSVGATLYALLSGQRLHQGRSDNEAFILAATQPAPSLARVAPELPVEVIALVDKALAWDPRNRWENAEAMRREVLRIIELLGGSVARPDDRASGPRAPGDRASHAEAPKAEEASAPVEEPDATEDDPVVQRLLEVFKRFERLLAAGRQYGWSHPEAENKLRALFQSIVETLRAHPTAVKWTVSPYAFIHRGQTVWEPGPPFDFVPYSLFASGVRGVRLAPGLRDDELATLCRVMLLDPTRDLAPEDDVAGALWEQKLEHVAYDVVNVYAEGDADDQEAFYDEAERLEEAARRAAEELADEREAAAMAVETDPAALRAARQAASVLGLDIVTKKTLGAQLALTSDRWMERFVDVLADALVNTRRHGDTVLVMSPIAAYIRDLVDERRFEQAFAFHDALLRAVAATATAHDLRDLRLVLSEGAFPPDLVRGLLVDPARASVPAGQAPPPPQPSSIDPEALVRWLDPLFRELGPSHFEMALEVLPTIQHEGLRNILLGYLERTMAGREAQAVDRVMTFDLEVARPIMRMLANLRTPAAIQGLKRLTACPKATLCCEAIALLTPNHEQLKDELGQLAESPDPEMRFAAIRTLAHHQVRPAGPLLVYRVQDDSFQQLSVEERREIIDALYSLHPSRAESLAIEILERHGLLLDESLEQTRTLCAQLLGREARSEEALEATQAATKRRWWNSPALREAAAAAAEAIAARLGKRAGAQGSTP